MLRPRFAASLALAASAFLAGPALAQKSGTAAAPRTQSLRFGLVLFAPTGDWTDPLDLGKNQFKATLGAGASYEFRFGGDFGLELGLQYMQPMIESGHYSDRARFVPWTAGVNYHYDLQGVKLYGGPELVYVMYGNPGIPGFEFKDELTWGLRVGADIPWRDEWAFNASLQYVDARAKRADGQSIDPKPLLLQAGVVYRF